MLVDSHCHLNDQAFEGGISQTIERAQKLGVAKFLNICTELSEADAIWQTSQDYQDVYCSVGVHPHEAVKEVDNPSFASQLQEKALRAKVIALGETGLDYYYEHSPKDAQVKIFNDHIALAEKTGLPLIIHTRDAERETIEILNENIGKVTGIIHCFSGSEWLAKSALELGFYISVSGIVTFPKAEEIRQALKIVPLERLLLETDAPYLAPVPLRGKRNEPAFVIHTAAALAELKGTTTQNLIDQTGHNFQKLFGQFL